MTAAQLSILIKARDEASRVLAGVQGQLGKVNAAAGGLGKTLGSALKVGALGAVAGIGALAFAVKGFVQEAAAAQKIQAQTNAVIASTKGVAGISSQAVNELAASLSRVIPIDDEVIQSAENMLLTFTNIGKNVFPQATEAVLNMSVALGEDTTSAAIQLGKALNDPIQGVTALRRVGVQLSDAQQQQVADFMAVNDIAGAQKIILGELETEFGNSARAAGDTFAGKMAILGTQIGNVKESLGTALLPVVTLVATVLGNFLADHQAQIESFGTIAALWLGQNIPIAVGFLIDKFVAARPIIEAFIDAFVLGLQTLRPIAEDVFNFLIEHKEAMVAAIAAIGVAIVVALGPGALAIVALVGLIEVIGLVRQHFDEITDFIDRKMGEWDEIITSVTRRIVSFIRDNWKLIRDIVEEEITAARLIIENAMDTIRDIFRIVTALLRGDWAAAWDAIRNLVDDRLAFIKDLVQNRMDLIRDVFQLVWNAINELTGGALNTMVGKLTAFVGAFYDAAHALGAAIMNGLKDALSSTAGFAGSVADAVLSAVKGAVNVVIDQINRTLEFSFDTHMPGVGTIHIDPPDIPHLARGGIVTSPTLALIAERGPEAVVPLGVAGAGAPFGGLVTPPGMSADEFKAALDAAVAFAEAAAASLKEALEAAVAFMKLFQAAPATLTDAIGKAWSDVQRTISQQTVEGATAALRLDQLRLDEMNQQMMVQKEQEARDIAVRGLEEQIAAIREGSARRVTQLEGDLAAKRAELAGFTQQLTGMLSIIQQAKNIVGIKEKQPRLIEAAQALAAAPGDLRLRMAFDKMLAKAETQAAKMQARVDAATKGITATEKAIVAEKAAAAARIASLTEEIEVLKATIGPNEERMNQIRFQIEEITFANQQQAILNDMLGLQIQLNNDLLPSYSELLDSVAAQVANAQELTGVYDNLTTGVFDTRDAAVLLRNDLEELANALLLVKAGLLDPDTIREWIGEGLQNAGAGGGVAGGGQPVTNNFYGAQFVIQGNNPAETLAALGLSAG